MNAGKPFPADYWIYAGSIFLEDGRYLAEDAGVLIGFVHDPASIIESHLSGKFPAYDTYVVNKNHLLSVGTEIRMIIKPIKIHEDKELRRSIKTNKEEVNGLEEKKAGN
jgi:Leu/Phe-tRNA-protein transferase